MKNKKIIKSLDKILPNESSKNAILNNILTKSKEKSSLNYKSLVPVLVCMLLLLIPLTNISDINNPIQVRTTGDIIYKGICYQENGIYNGDIADLEFIEQSKEFIMGDKIYRVNDSIIFQNGENYIEFIKCGG